MKKFLVMLMVVAMASFLFVGCFGVTPPVPDEPVEPVEPVSTPPTILDIQDEDGKPIVVDLTATDTEYINETEAGNYVLVVGTAPVGSLVKVYIGSAATPVAVGEAAITGLFSVAIVEPALGVDGAKTLYATTTELGLEESASSNVVKFTLDTVAPYMAKLAADLDEETVTVTFNEAVVEDTVDDAATWFVEDIDHHLDTNEPTSVEIISSKIVELAVDVTITVGDPVIVDDTILVICEDVEDLAGNITSLSSKTCDLK